MYSKQLDEDIPPCLTCCGLCMMLGQQPQFKVRHQKTDFYMGLQHMHTQSVQTPDIRVLVNYILWQAVSTYTLQMYLLLMLEKLLMCHTV